MLSTRKKYALTWEEVERMNSLCRFEEMSFCQLNGFIMTMLILIMARLEGWLGRKLNRDRIEFIEDRGTWLGGIP